MNFFTSPNDLQKWVKEFGSSDEAAMKLMEVVGKNSEQDIVQTCQAIFDGKDGTAATVLFDILGRHNITQKREGNMKEKMIKEAQIIGRDAPLYANMELKVCPKLPFSVGKRLISTYNCRNQCLDSLVFDDDPNRVYCAEALWRRHVMDKFSREFKDKDGKWVGGYINERFQTFKDDGGNQMQLAHGERTRMPRPHQFSTERRLEEARGEETTDLTASSKQFIKLASVEGKEVEDDTYKMFDDIIEMKQAGLSDEDIIYKVAEHYNKTILNVASIHRAASKMFNAHNGMVYAHTRPTLNKVAQVGLPPKSTVMAIQDIPINLVGGGQDTLPMGSVVVVQPERLQNKTVFEFDGNKFVLNENANETALFKPMDDEQYGNIQETADQLGLNETPSAQDDDFPVEQM